MAQRTLAPQFAVRSTPPWQGPDADHTRAHGRFTKYSDPLISQPAHYGDHLFYLENVDPQVNAVLETEQGIAAGNSQTFVLHPKTGQWSGRHDTTWPKLTIHHRSKRRSGLNLPVIPQPSLPDRGPQSATASDTATLIGLMVPLQ